MTLDIMMPFYGRVDHFRIAVESVLAQTDPDWRLVVIDDCYPDVTAGEWLVGLADPRIVYRRNPVNAGINVNFQASIDLAVNEWLTIFGCDDVMLPGYVARVKALGQAHPTADFIHPGTRVIDGDGRVYRPLVDRMKALYRPHVRGTIELGGEKLAVSVTRGNWMNFPAIAWRRSAVAAVGFRPNLSVIQDLGLALDVAFQGGSLLLDDEVVFEYRRHASSVSSWRAAEGSRFVEEQRFFRALAAEFEEHGWPRAARTARWHISSRINALTRLPEAVSARQTAGIRILARHALGLSLAERAERR
ncbi:glycosyltransferase [Cryobacterium sp. GrIS_2_6]|uniref:glycosyltransferase family 2 protein n=1 Tax=Cryobacterium sp. GrIS_2_6 TaxID=3162785 RepID=UPI002E089395|nr:glycosyltransferase involved in cell wall biosynthesis [Cryobacterium psychrotolerans]